MKYTKGLQDRDFRNTLDYVSIGYKVRVYDRTKECFPTLYRFSDYH